ncbi:hypothetical protein [uncultured Acetobacterium sp.]|uniref:hypothetical protein n=1 Tax=uncultured Acetobacterium sp. TaxID=217139 RepID=UPI0025E30429|nr:hypothetical protein [uncultured Acetobacterium sp.]
MDGKSGGICLEKIWLVARKCQTVIDLYVSVKYSPPTQTEQNLLKSPHNKTGGDFC